MICFIDIDQDIIQIDNDKEIELFNQNLVDLAYKACWCVE